MRTEELPLFPFRSPDADRDRLDAPVTRVRLPAGASIVYGLAELPVTW